MSNVIAFPKRAAPPTDDDDIDLLSAVDLAIRDLREISEIACASAQTRARECLTMLEDAYAAAFKG